MSLDVVFDDNTMLRKGPATGDKMQGGDPETFDDSQSKRKVKVLKVLKSQ